jgi:hypothetical protein
MITMVHTETAVKLRLNQLVEKRILSPADAIRLYRWGYKIALATVSNWRRRTTDNAMIDQAVQRKKQEATLALRQAGTANQKNLANRERILALMCEAVWKGMQEDAAEYTHR